MTLHTAYMYVCIVALEFCTDLELLALFIAALCHDLDHQVQATHRSCVDSFDLVT